MVGRPSYHHGEANNYEMCVRGGVEVLAKRIFALAGVKSTTSGARWVCRNARQSEKKN